MTVKDSVRYHTWSGASNTYATVLVWNEARFAYDELVDCVIGRDAAEDFRWLHNPPLVIVRRISYV